MKFVLSRKFNPYRLLIIIKIGVMFVKICDVLVNIDCYVYRLRVLCCILLYINVCSYSSFRKCH